MRRKKKRVMTEVGMIDRESGVDVEMRMMMMRKVVVRLVALVRLRNVVSG